MLGGIKYVDYSLATRTMAFDINKLKWDNKILCISGIDAGLFPAPVQSGTAVGKITQEMADALGLSHDTILVMGAHDQTNDEVLKHATPSDVRNELNSQIELAVSWGLMPSHFDRHMHTVTLDSDFYDIYVALSQKYNTMYQIVKTEYEEFAINTKTLDYLIGIGGEPGLSLEQKYDCLYQTLQNIKPGVTQLTVHPVIDTPEIRYIIPDWYERYYEYQIFMADETLKIIKENNIKLISYKDLINMKG